MDQCESKSVYELLWHSGGNFLEAFLPATLGMTLLFHKTISVTVAGSGASVDIHQHSKSTQLLENSEKWSLTERTHHYMYTAESVERLECFKSTGKASKSPVKEERRNDRRYSQNDSVW